MRTAGIDLATLPRNSAVCVVDWAAGTVAFPADRSDAALLEVCRTADKVGVACPFGWPEPFVAAVRAHAGGWRWPGRDQDAAAFAAHLAGRETDRAVRALTAVVPPPVAADRTALAAMRCAQLLDALGDVDRRGATGALVEVHPAATLRVLGLPWRGYRGAAARAVRASTIDALAPRAPGLTFDAEVRAACARSDHHLDALVCALTARAAACGRTVLPEPGEQMRLAGVEGWIHVPQAPVDDTWLG